MGRQNKGFTIVELVVVIAIIAILALLAINVFVGIQEDAKISVAKDELKSAETGVLKMSIDIGKWPNGCPVGDTNNPEVAVEASTAGLTQLPPVGVVQSPCEWTAQDIADWQGPYLGNDQVLDGWDNSYMFDPDYHPFRDCPSETEQATIVALVSYGEDGTQYTCDDIWRNLDNY